MATVTPMQPAAPLFLPAPAEIYRFTIEQYDRMVHARGGVPVYWIIDLIDNRIEVYTDPNPAYGYRTRVDYQPGDHVPIVIDTRVCGRISVPDLLSARVEGHDEVRPS